MPKPCYFVSVATQAARTRVLVNDAIVFQELLGYPVRARIPINKWIRAGANRLEINIGGANGPATAAGRCRCEVTTTDAESPASDREILGELQASSPLGTEGEATAGPSVLDFQASIAFSLWAWMSATEIDGNDPAVRLLGDEITAIHRLLSERDVEGLVSLVRERTQEHSIAGYSTVDQKTVDARREFQQIVDSAELQLQPLALREARLRLHGGRRLASVETPEGRSPVYYSDASGKLRTYIPFVWRRGAAGWIVTR